MLCTNVTIINDTTTTTNNETVWVMVTLCLNNFTDQMFNIDHDKQFQVGGGGGIVN